MRICSSAGSVTVAVPLLTVIACFLPLEIFGDIVQPGEPLRPRALVAAHPVVDGLERRAVEPVDPVPARLADVDRPDLAQHPQMLGDLGLGEPEHSHKLAHRALAAGQDVEDLSAPWLGHGVERVGGGRCAGHGAASYTHMGMRQAAASEAALRTIASALRSMSASVVLQFETDTRIAA